MSSHRPRPLGELAQAVMDCIWEKGPITSEGVREALKTAWPMKESTVRTILRRLETKGYVSHTMDGRTFVYRATEGQAAVAVRSVQHIIDKLCGGSAEALVVGMVNHDVLSAKDLERLAAKITRAKGTKK